MPAVDRAVLRLEAYELAHRPEVPTSAVLTEAVEPGVLVFDRRLGPLRQRHAGQDGRGATALSPAAAVAAEDAPRPHGGVDRSRCSGGPASRPRRDESAARRWIEGEAKRRGAGGARHGGGIGCSRRGAGGGGAPGPSVGSWAGDGRLLDLGGPPGTGAGERGGGRARRLGLREHRLAQIAAETASGNEAAAAVLRSTSFRSVIERDGRQAWLGRRSPSIRLCRRRPATPRAAGTSPSPTRWWARVRPTWWWCPGSISRRLPMGDRGHDLLVELAQVGRMAVFDKQGIGLSERTAPGWERSRIAWTTSAR